MGEYQKLSDAYLSDAYYKGYSLYKKNNEYTYKEIEDYVFDDDDKYSFKEIKDQRISDSDCRTSSEEEKQKALERLMQG
jgi:hypothetical protein